MADDDERYAQVYRNPDLGRRLDSLSERFHFTDESSRFSKLVSIFDSRRRPYHRWARYREGYSGELVKELIHRSDVDFRKHFVIDPMCGSGSTLVAAKELGCDSVGFDVNPFAVDLTNAKVDRYGNANLRSVNQMLENYVVAGDAVGSVPPGMELCRQYFNEDNFKELASIRRWMESAEDPRAAALMEIAWLTILEDCSNRRKDGNGLSTTSTRVNDVWEFFCERIRMICDDIRNNPLPSGAVSIAKTISVLDSAQDVREFSSKVEKDPKAVIFSPPYANSFDYFETYKMELLMGGYCGLDGLAKLREGAIRNYRKGYKRELVSGDELVEMICQEIWSAIPEKEEVTRVRDARTRLVPNLLRGYFEDMSRSIQTISRMLPKRGCCHIVVDQSAYVGVIIPTDILLAQIAEKHGFDVIMIVRCRRANTSGQQLARYPYLKTMLRGSIVSLKKN